MSPSLSVFFLNLSLILITSQTVELYHPTNDLVAILRHQATICPHAHPQWLSLEHTSLSHLLSHPPQGRLLIITISRNAKFRAALTRANVAKAHRTTLVAVFGEHARERVTTELALEILARYCHSAPPWADFVLIPVANLQARRRVDAGIHCERLNQRSVDLNRNYAHSWGLTDRDTVAEEEPPGVRPLSEFETAAIDALVQRLRPSAYVSVHSGDTAVLVPWDSGEPVGGWITSVANVVRRRHCPMCRVGSAQTLFGYRAYGSGVDHMFGVRQVPFACTLEIYGSPGDDCRLMFNPSSRGALDQVLRNWSGVLETIGREVSGRVATESWWDEFAIPRGYQVKVVEDGEEEAPSDRAATYVILFVVTVGIVLIAVQKALGCSWRSTVRRRVSNRSVRLATKCAVGGGRSKLAV